MVGATNVAHTQYGNGYVQDIAVNASSNGNNTLFAAVAGSIIVVLGGDLMASSSVTITVQDSNGTVMDGPFTPAANGGKIYPHNDRGHFATGRGFGLVLNLGSAVQVGGHLKIALVDNQG